MVMSTYRVMHKDANNEGRFHDVEAADPAQAIWNAATQGDGSALVGVNEVNADGSLAIVNTAPDPSVTDG
jgi:hypothetical protein